MANLTAEGRAALDAVIAAHQVRVTVRQQAETDARKMVEDRVAAAARLESEAVRAAIAAKVPRSRIGSEGLNTKDYRTVSKVLALTEAVAEGAVAAVEVARSRLHRVQVRRATAAETAEHRAALHPSGDVLLRIDWPGFEADALGITAENAGTATLDLDGWAHRLYPGEDDDWDAIGGGRVLADAVQYETRLQQALRDALTP